MSTAVATPVRLSGRGDEAVVEDLEWQSVPFGLLREARPWRTFRWDKGQQHYSGTYWAATVRDHVIYESRLELGRLLFADFAPEVRHIVAQHQWTGIGQQQVVRDGFFNRWRGLTSTRPSASSSPDSGS